MDPDANLIEQRHIAARITAIYDAADPDTGDWTEDQELELVRLAIRLAELVVALDGWLRGGGFLPAGWKGDR